MDITLPNHTDRDKERYYTEDELHLLYQLENGLVPVRSHDEVMDNLKRALKLDEI